MRHTAAASVSLFSPGVCWTPDLSILSGSPPALIESSLFPEINFLLKTTVFSPRKENTDLLFSQERKPLIQPQNPRISEFLEYKSILMMSILIQII